MFLPIGGLRGVGAWPFFTEIHIFVNENAATSGGRSAAGGRGRNTKNHRNMAGHTAAAALAALILTLGGCHRGRPPVIIPEGVELRPGDVLLRRGSGMASRAVLMAGGGGDYSHVGIAADSAGVVMVVHAVPDEPDYPGDPDRVKMEPPAAFYDGGRADRGCVMRCADSAAARRAAARAVELYRRGTLFDHDYDDADTTRMYCCELVSAAFRAAGTDIAPLPRHSVSLPGLRLDSVMLPSDFRRSPALRVVAEFP